MGLEGNRAAEVRVDAQLVVAIAATRWQRKRHTARERLELDAAERRERRAALPPLRAVDRRRIWQCHGGVLWGMGRVRAGARGGPRAQLGLVGPPRSPLLCVLARQAPRETTGARWMVARALSSSF